MTGLVEFLKARYLEDEASGEADAFPPPGYADADRQARGVRVLAEVEAKRGTVRLYEDTLATIETLKEQGQPTAAHEVAAESYLNVLRLDAAVFASHPEYDESWRP